MQRLYARKQLLKKLGYFTLLAALVICGATNTVSAATFGKVVPIAGAAADIALDEARGVLYIANYTANRVDVMSLNDYSIRRSMNVAAQPGGLAISPDGRYLVITHFSPGDTPSSSNNALTVIDLSDDSRQTFGMGDPALGVAFGADGLALVVTTSNFILFDPALGTTQVLGSILDVVAKSLPVDLATAPPDIVKASVTASGDGMKIFGVIDTFQSSAGSTTGIRFVYNVYSKLVGALGFSSSPALGPRVVSVSQDGSYYLEGWALFGCEKSVFGNCNVGSSLVAQFRNASGQLAVGSHAIDSTAGIVYAQMTAKATGASQSTTKAASGPPVLMILDADNLAVREQLQLPENLAGRSILDSSRSVLYSISDSGVLVMPVGRINRAPRLAAAQEDVVFQGNFCDRRVQTQQITINDLGGNNVPFVLSADNPAVRVSPPAGVTPATVTVTVDLGAVANLKGTTIASIQIQSGAAINVVKPVRVLINSHEPDQRGSIFNVSGKLVDLLADPVRDRFYVLRQDTNQVLVFDGSSYKQIAVLRTSNTPTQMAFTFDRRYLLVGHDDSQMAYVFDLETLQPDQPIRMPFGHYPRSIAVSGKSILVASRVAGPTHTVESVDFYSRSAVTLPSLGVFKNSVHINTVLEASPNGSSILAVMPDGNVMLYDATADTFTVSRKDFQSLSGAYAASSFGYYVVDNNLLNASLVPMGKLDAGMGGSSGFAFVDGTAGMRTTASDSGLGMIQRMSVPNQGGALSTRIIEAPLRGTTDAAFIRSLAPLANRGAIVALSASGFTILPWNYYAAIAPPRIDTVVNAADGTQPIAPGGLITVYGNNLSPINAATSQIPLPTALGESCLTVNGMAMPMLFVSPAQINAQLPFRVDGSATMVLHTPGGVSDNVNLTILPAAPSVFHSGQAGPSTGIATIVRSANNELVTLSNPVHAKDNLVIYLTGMGRTLPEVDTGAAAPAGTSAVIPPIVTLGGVPLPIAFAGLSPGEIGVYQINVSVPFKGVPAGLDIPLTISQGGSSTTLSVRVVE